MSPAVATAERTSFTAMTTGGDFWRSWPTTCTFGRDGGVRPRVSTFLSKVVSLGLTPRFARASPGGRDDHRGLVDDAGAVYLRRRPDRAGIRQHDHGQHHGDGAQPPLPLG